MKWHETFCQARNHNKANILSAQMKNIFLLAAVVSIVPLVAWKPPGASDVPTRSRAASAILVELFTSEGCSSCPPADTLLQELDRSPSASGAQVVVLSEHVDYWNHLGWQDPYSSRFFSDRQSAYAARFELASAYTPQMVVDGSAEFVGSDSRLANQALEKASNAEKIPIRISAMGGEGRNGFWVHVEAGPLPAGAREAGVYLVVALNHAESQVARGENTGRHLTHVAVVSSLTQVGTLGKAKGFIKDIQVKLEHGDDPGNLRLIAFVQEAGPGRVLGVTMQPLGK